ncbi:hypothetical protein FB451DRAFT_1560649 [Mycena latifolia]|nr:hypothetical protein FB451DRAFT_1560649 [Mycena latifolia]
MDEKSRVLATLLQSTDADIDDYKRWSRFPSSLAQDPAYSASNVLDWIKLDKFREYLSHKRANTTPDAPKKAADVIEISDSEGTPPPPHPHHPPDVKPVLREIINLCSDDDPSDPVKHEVKVEPSLASHKQPPGRFRKGGATTPVIRITRNEKVVRVVELKQIPERFPITDEDTAFILDFSGDDRAKKQTKGGKPRGLDAFLKNEDQDSWGKGSNGSTTRDTLLKVLGDIPSRRSVHRCNGGYKCEFFDPVLLAGYQRTDAEDMALTRAIFARELLQNQTDSGSSVGRATSFFRVIARYKQRGCPKAGCPGIPILKKLREGPSKDGKLMFVGCSHWAKGDKWSHYYVAIPADVDEELLPKYFDGSVIPPEDLETHEGEALCARLAHPRHGKQGECPHVHLRDGKAVTGRMVMHSCPATKIVYTSKDPDVQKCVVIFRGLHSHPPWPMEKPSHAAKEDVKKCVAAGGMLGETGGHLNNSHTTKAVLGTSLDVKHPAFRDTRRLRDEVSKLKSDGTPAGLLWAGILEDYAEDLKRPLAQRYIHHIRMDGAMKIAVAMNPELAALLHDAGVRFLEGDITFKRTKGEMNEWEAAIWYTPTPERVTISRIYTNAASKEAFTHLFDAFFTTVKAVTGKSVRFKAFHPRGNLYSIHFDMEAAQVQGLGVWLSKMVLDDPALRARFPSLDPDQLVQFILKLCSVHLERSTDELVPLVGQKTVDYLNRIRGLSDPADIENWHQFCKMHENKELRDWYAHKVMYPWLLPGYNESLSSFPKGFWQQSPSHTNLVESAHVATNKATKINLLPVEAVRTARIFDAEKAASIAAARQTCISINRNNHDQSRMRRNVTRTAKRQTYRQEHDNVGDSIAQAQEELASIAQAKKDLAARLKELKSQKKELGRVPRHSTSRRVVQSTSSIPRLVGRVPDSECEKSDSDGSGAPSSPAQGPSSSPVSSPAPNLRPLDDNDTDMFPPGICANTLHLPSDLLEITSEAPTPQSVLTDDDIAAFLDTMPPFNEATPMFDDTMPPFDMDFFNNFDFNSLGLPLDALGLLPPALPSSSPPPEWPRLPAVPSSSPPSDPSSDPAPIVPPSPPKRKRRLEVDPADIIDEPRARKGEGVVWRGVTHIRSTLRCPDARRRGGSTPPCTLSLPRPRSPRKYLYTSPPSIRADLGRAFTFAFAHARVRIRAGFDPHARYAAGSIGAAHAHSACPSLPLRQYHSRTSKGKMEPMMFLERWKGGGPQEF